MKRISILSVLLACMMTLSASASFADNVPDFGQYPVKEIFKGTPAPIDLKSTPGASLFRTRLREGAKKGPNFAGKYTIIGWGCGTGCTVLAVVDATTGRVVFPKEIEPVFFVGLPEGHQLTDKYDIKFQKDSRLLIIHGIPNQKTNVGSYYYVWQDGHFELIFSREWETEFNK
jgi:hypothetical protein